MQLDTLPPDIKSPIYGRDNITRPGLYFGLFHGRREKDQLEDWGFNGPMLGPLLFCHTTYGNHVKLRFVDADAFRASLPGMELPSMLTCYGDKVQTEEVNLELWVSNDDNHIQCGCLKLGDYYYGDWTCFSSEVYVAARRT